MGTNQHLIRSIDAIIKQGGVRIGPDEYLFRLNACSPPRAS